MGIINDIFNKRKNEEKIIPKESSKTQEKLALEESRKKQKNIKLKMNDEEKEAIKDFESMNSQTNKEHHKILYFNGEYQDILYLYEYKEEKFIEAISSYYSVYDSEKEKFTLVFYDNNYGVVDNKKDNTLYLKEINLGSEHILYEAKKLEDRLLEATTKEEVDGYVKIFNENVAELLVKASSGKILPLEEYKKTTETNEESKRRLDEEVKKAEAQTKLRQIQYEDRKKYYFDGCQGASKEELLKAFEELLKDEKYIKRPSELYKKMVISHAKFRILKDDKEAREKYTKMVEEVLKEYDKKEQNNSFSYSLDNHHPKSDDDDDGALAAAPNKKSKK